MRLRVNEGAVLPIPGNKKYTEMPITPDMDFRTIGVGDKECSLIYPIMSKFKHKVISISI